MPGPRSAQQLIDQAIAENRLGERLCYILVVVFVVIGIGVIIWGASAGQGVVSIAGSIASLLFWPAMREARQIRKENMAIRLLEDPLSRAETAEEAARALRDAFVAIFVGKKD
jgi:hypothetical protein